MAYALCREIELGIWEPSDINGKEIIRVIEDRFGIEQFAKKE